MFGEDTAVQASRVGTSLENVVCISPPLQPATLAALGNVTHSNPNPNPNNTPTHPNPHRDPNPNPEPHLHPKPKP